MTCQQIPWTAGERRPSAYIIPVIQWAKQRSWRPGWTQDVTLTGSLAQQLEVQA